MAPTMAGAVLKEWHGAAPRVSAAGGVTRCWLPHCRSQVHPTWTIGRRQTQAFGRALGQAGLRRFERDVLDQSGIKYAFVCRGVNDILFPEFLFTPLSERVTAENIRPTRLLPAYADDDHLHVNDAGNLAQANAIPLTLFQRVRG
jgi:hypothetical protein